MSDAIETVGDLASAVLEANGIRLAFGVISIHNMPILDAFHTRGVVRFVTARGEAGAANMADAAARVSDTLGVVVTSTGTGAGNAAGALVEAMTAGTPMLHLTGQIERRYLDRRNWGYIHEAPSQLAMLKAVSKEAFRIGEPREALAVLREAIQCALTAPTGPVSIEIPIDVQQAAYDGPRETLIVERAAPPIPAASLLDQIADKIAAARHPLLWVGGGARAAGSAVRRLADQGVGVITSTGGRGILAEDHPLSLGAFTQTKATERVYETVDCMVIAGSHLRSNETRTYALKLPGERYRIDIDPGAENRGYGCELFVHGDAVAALNGLADRLATRKLAADKGFAALIANVRAAAIAETERSIGPYAVLPRTLIELMPRDAIWARDITLSNSLWGNRLPRVHSPRQSVYAMGGGIGQGVPMAIGAALAASGRKTIALAGDGGFALSLGEVATAVETQADILFLLMNDGGYGVIRNIQDAAYGGRRCYTELVAPDFAAFANSLGMPHRIVRAIDEIPAALAAAMREAGPRLLEIDMRAIGPLAQNYAGPPGAARA